MPEHDSESRSEIGLDSREAAPLLSPLDTARVIRSTHDRREQAFLDYVESTEAYFAKVEADGDTPWHGGDIELRRDLYMRRFTRPEPPAGLYVDPRGHIRAESIRPHKPEVAA